MMCDHKIREEKYLSFVFSLPHEKRDIFSCRYHRHARRLTRLFTCLCTNQNLYENQSSFTNEKRNRCKNEYAHISFPDVFLYYLLKILLTSSDVLDVRIVDSPNAKIHFDLSTTIILCLCILLKVTQPSVLSLYLVIAHSWNSSLFVLIIIRIE